MKNINWLDHIANLLVVILGISIAFYMEGYKEIKASKKQEKQYLESLIKDLETDLEALDTLQEVNKHIGNSILKLSNASIGAPYHSDSLVSYILSTQYNPSFSPQITTYESLKSSGKMDLISDFELRNLIGELYEQYYRGASQYDEAINQDLRDFYKPFFFRNIVFTGRNKVNEDFLSVVEFRNIIFAYRYLYSAKSGFYEIVEEQIDSVLVELRKHDQKL